MKEEIWKDIPNYEGIYQASTFGRIRTCANKTTFTERHGVRHWKQRILKHRGEYYKTGYRVTLWKNGKPKDFLVARLVATTFLGKSDLTINHIDGNRFNNHIENLEWCTIAENVRKAFEMGLVPQRKVTLTNKKTKEVSTFRSMSETSKFLGFNHGYISCMVNRGIFENEEYKWRVDRYKKEKDFYPKYPK